MNTRKIKRLNKRIILTSFVKPLKRKGWHINGYFHDGGYSNTPSSCYKFWVDELPRINFAIWMHEGKPLCFGEDWMSIDKFKPSYCRNFNTYEDFHESFIDYKNGKKSWKSVIQDEFGNCLYLPYSEDMSDEDFINQYNEDYKERVFELEHSYLNYDEWDKLQNHLNRIIPILKENEYIDSLCMETGYPFFKHWCTIQPFFNDKINELTDEQFDDLIKDLRTIIIYDENNKYVSGVGFGITWIEGRIQRTAEEVRNYLCPNNIRYGRKNTEIVWLKGNINSIKD